MKMQFPAKAKEGKLIFKTETAKRYLLENDEKDLLATIQEDHGASGKQQMYNYLYGVVYPSAVKAFRYFGYEYANDEWVDHKFKSMFAFKKKTDKQGNVYKYLEDKSKMPKDRLHTFITDCILFVEKEMEWEVPDSSEWKASKDSGRNYKKVNK